MNYITEIKPYKKNSDALIISFDNGRNIIAHCKTVRENGLKIGLHVSFEDLSRILYESDISAAYDKSLRYLGYRARSCRELHNYLERKGFNRQVIGDVINKLKDYGFLNDADFADRWIENRNLLKPVSRRQLHSELKNKGIENNILQAALSSITDNIELNNAYLLAKKYINKYSNLTKKEIRDKTAQSLLRKGFDWEIVRSAVNKALMETDDNY